SGPKREVATAGGSVIYRPKLPPAASVAPVRVQKVDERHPVIHHPPVTEVTAKYDSRTGSRSTASPAVQPRGQREATATPQRPASTRSEPRSSESPTPPRTTEPRSTPRPPENRPSPSATQPTTPRREPAATTPSDPRSVPRASESRSVPTRPEEPVR